MNLATSSPTLAPISMPALRAFAVPPQHIALWWLGQAGFVIKTPQGIIVALDPYLSNSCKALGEGLGFDMDRLVPPPLAPEELAGVAVYVMTHSHQDHLDPETLSGYRAAGGQGPFVAPAETAQKLRELGVPQDQIRLTWPNCEHQFGDLTLRATFAIPLGGDDLTHVGYLARIEGGPTVYFTGDTAYHDVIADSVGEHRPDVMATVINGAFRNMGPEAAAHLARRLDPQFVIPCHHDLFRDNMQPPHMLHTCLKLEGIGERYCPLRHGEPRLFGVKTP